MGSAFRENDKKFVVEYVLKEDNGKVTSVSLSRKDMPELMKEKGFEEAAWNDFISDAEGLVKKHPLLGKSKTGGGGRTALFFVVSIHISIEKERARVELPRPTTAWITWIIPGLVADMAEQF